MIGDKCLRVLHKDPLSHRIVTNIFESVSATSQSWHRIINKKVSCLVKFSRGGKASVKELSRIAVVICLFQEGLCSLSALLSLFSFLQSILVLYSCV